MSKFYFPLKPDHSVEKVLEGLQPINRVKVRALIEVMTDDDIVSALLRTLKGNEEFDWPSQAQFFPAADHVVVTKPKREPKLKQPRRYKSGEKVECPQCHNQVSTMYMLRDGSKCKMCAIKAKRLAKSQEPEKSQDAGLPETWTNKRPEFGREEVMANVQDKTKEKINLANLSGRRVG